MFGNAEISWNYVEFEVRYESLSEEIKIGEFMYLTLVVLWTLMLVSEKIPMPCRRRLN